MSYNHIWLLAQNIPNEAVFTANCYRFVNHSYPHYRRLFFHVPNELYRLPGETQQSHMHRLSTQKAQGVVKGVPDFLCMAPLFAIELKTPTGRLSPEQQSLHQLWRERGIKVYVCYNASEFIAAITHELGECP